MSKEAKIVCYFIGLACLAMFMLSGCKHSGVQGYIYHEGMLHAKTNCARDLVFEINPAHVIVETIDYGYGERLVHEKYKYENDGKYTVERKECEY